MRSASRLTSLLCLSGIEALPFRKRARSEMRALARLAVRALAMIALTVLGTAASAQPAPADPAALVNRFLSLLESDERAAGAMLTGDFTIAAGDVGGSVTVAELRQLMHLIGRDCRLGRLAPDPSFPPSEPPVVSVAGHYHCVTRERPEGHDMEVDYLVQGEKIAGMYMHDANENRGPRPGENRR